MREVEKLDDGTVMRFLLVRVLYLALGKEVASETNGLLNRQFTDGRV